MADDYFRFSHSSGGTLESCARKFEFNKMFQHRVRDFDTYAADVGKALHKGYQNYLVHRDDNKALWELMKAYPYEAAWNQEKDDRSIQAATVTLETMIESEPMAEWRVAEIMHPSGLIVPAIEVPYELRLKGLTLPDGRGIAHTGFVDAYMRNILDDRLGTLDIKTHRSFLKVKEAKYKFSGQPVPYGIVLEHAQGKKIDKFQVHFLDCFVDLAEPQVELFTFPKTESDAREWLMNTVLKAQMIQRFAEIDYFPRTDNGCAYFNKPCRYLEICSIRDRKQIEAWLLEGQEAKEEEPWNPWIVAEIDVFAEAA